MLASSFPLAAPSVDPPPDLLPDDDLTVLLDRARAGEAGAQERLAAAVQPYLQRLAGQQLRRSPDSVLESAALLNEAWVRLCGDGVKAYEGRTHFLRAASRTMRSILVDRARARAALKRGGGATKLELEDDVAATSSDLEDLLDLDEALARLEPADAELAELRLFGGLSAAEIAALSRSSKRTVERRWNFVAARLKRELGR